MKKFFRAAAPLALAVLCLALAACGAATGPVKFTDKALGISLEYPGTWGIQRDLGSDADAVAFIKATDPTTMTPSPENTQATPEADSTAGVADTATAPAGTPDTTPQTATGTPDAATLTATPASSQTAVTGTPAPDQVLPAYSPTLLIVKGDVVANLLDLTAAELLDAAQYPDLKIEKDEKQSLSGADAKHLIYSYTFKNDDYPEGVTLRVEEFRQTQNDSTYCFTFVCREDRYLEVQKEFLDIYTSIAYLD